MNLTCANRVILVDQWWNSAVERQAFGRVHRIGQSKPTYFVKILTKNTIDERLADLQAEKNKSISTTLREGGDYVHPPLTLEEMTRLFNFTRNIDSETGSSTEGDDDGYDDGEEQGDGDSRGHSQAGSQDGRGEDSQSRFGVPLEDFEEDFEEGLRREFEGGLEQDFEESDNDLPGDDAGEISEDE